MSRHKENLLPDIEEEHDLVSRKDPQQKYRSEFSPHRTPPPRNTVFLVDESTFQSVMPRISHWSIAWSDLMMTMFILFLSMFIYQAAHKDFLVTDEVEVVGGETADALEITEEGFSLPFNPIQSSAPLITSGTIKKVETTSIRDIEDNMVFYDDKDGSSLERIRKNALPVLPPVNIEKQAPEATQPTPEQQEEALEKITQEPQSHEKTIPPPPAAEDVEGKSSINEIFTINKDNLKYFNLGKFAEISLVPDKTVRIILTGDLLFQIGSSELSSSAIISLQKMGLALLGTPYMINVVGHTDNIPMNSAKFSSNWELSLARASSVARFLIEEIGMTPNQFVVSGYSSFRPVVSNTTAENRAKNRRVEIIISKKMPPPVPVNRNTIE